MNFDYNDLMQILPHRAPMLLLDRAWLADGAACGEKTITGDEWFLQGHFPDDPVVPGVILCEILAQSACVLPEVTPPSAPAGPADTAASTGQTEAASGPDNAAPTGPGRQTFLAGLESVRFRRPVRPGDCFRTQCQLLRAKPPFFWVKGKGFVGDELCVSAEFSFAVR